MLILILVIISANINVSIITALRAGPEKAAPAPPAERGGDRGGAGRGLSVALETGKLKAEN